MTPANIMRRIRRAVSPDLLHARYRDMTRVHFLAGHCYAASEALYHLLGGKAAGLTPHSARDAFGGIHWYLVNAAGEILDPTADQYRIGRNCEPPYAEGTPRGFLTRAPSKRARIIMERVQNEYAC